MESYYSSFLFGCMLINGFCFSLLSVGGQVDKISSAWETSRKVILITGLFFPRFICESLIEYVFSLALYMSNIALLAFFKLCPLLMLIVLLIFVVPVLLYPFHFPHLTLKMMGKECKISTWQWKMPLENIHYGQVPLMKRLTVQWR